MKLTALTLTKLRVNLSARFFLTGMLLIAAVGALVLRVATAGSFGFGTLTAQAAAVGFQEELQLQLSSNGFTPGEVQRAAGTFAIAVENSAISGEYRLQLKAQDGTVIKEVEVQQGSAAWTVTLPAGEYTLTEASHPQWLCRITVQ